MDQTQKNQKTVLSLGFGKAGSQLHLPNWLQAGFEVIAYVPDMTTFDASTLHHVAQEALRGGALTVIHSLEKLPVHPTIVDIVTPSGYHTSAMQHYLETTAKQSIPLPKAWVIEKPVISSKEELALLSDLIETYDIDQASIFVNENYVASVALEHIRSVVQRQAERKNFVTSVDVVFYKDRVPDVRRGRFTDPILGAYGIEMPHQLAAAYLLTDTYSHTSTHIVTNLYHTKVNGLEHSEATYTHLRTLSGVDIRIAQGLGPFVIDEMGDITPKENPRITRYITVTFADNTTAKIYFDPAPNIQRFYSIVSWTEDGRPHTLQLPDNTIERVFEAVVRYTETGQREPFTEGLSVISAVNYFTSLKNLRDSAQIK